MTSQPLTPERRAEFDRGACQGCGEPVLAGSEGELERVLEKHPNVRFWCAECGQHLVDDR